MTKTLYIISGANGSGKLHKNLVDKYLIFFNGDDNYELVAEDKEILDEDLYTLFLKGFENE